jgi:hypothetical protein
MGCVRVCCLFWQPEGMTVNTTAYISMDDPAEVKVRVNCFDGHGQQLTTWSFADQM